MSMKQTALKFAPKLIGMKENTAVHEILRRGCAVQFIVMDGRRCGQNATVKNDTVCLFTDKGVVFHVVVGSRGIYEHPYYLAATPRTPEDDLLPV